MVLNTSGEPDALITSSGDIILDPRAVDGVAIVSATFFEAVFPLQPTSSPCETSSQVTIMANDPSGPGVTIPAVTVTHVLVVTVVQTVTSTMTLPPSSEIPSAPNQTNPAWYVSQPSEVPHYSSSSYSTTAFWTAEVTAGLVVGVLGILIGITAIVVVFVRRRPSKTETSPPRNLFGMWRPFSRARRIRRDDRPLCLPSPTQSDLEAYIRRPPAAEKLVELPANNRLSVPPTLTDVRASRTSSSQTLVIESPMGSTFAAPPSAQGFVRGVDQPFERARSSSRLRRPSAQADKALDL